MDGIYQKGNLLKEGKIKVNKINEGSKCRDTLQISEALWEPNEMREKLGIFCTWRKQEISFSRFWACKRMTHSQDMGLTWFRCQFLGNSVKPLLSEYVLSLQERAGKWIIAMQSLLITYISFEWGLITYSSYRGPIMKQMLLHLLTVLGKK